MWRWLQKVWHFKGSAVPSSKTKAKKVLFDNRCGGAWHLHLVATLLLALPHPVGRHPLLREPMDKMFSALPDLYNTCKQSDKVKLFIDVELSKRNLSAPIELGLRANQTIAQGEVVCMYGGKLFGAQAVRKAKVSASISHACTIAGLINTWVMDGLPHAMMILRPVPFNAAGLQAIADAGVEALHPCAVRDGFSEQEIKDFEQTPFGFMANCSVNDDPNMRLDWLPFNENLCQLPQLVATRPIEAGEQLTWNYNNNERKRLLQIHKEQHCDVCCGTDSPDNNPIICCIEKTCLSGRHRDCWTGEKPSLAADALLALIHGCDQHRPRQKLPRAAASATAAAAGAVASKRPLDNLPSLRSLSATDPDPHAASAVSTAAKEPDQVYLLPAHWQEGLSWNCRQQGLEMRPSTIANAGHGVFATRQFSKGDLIGWLWGYFVTDGDFQRMIKDEPSDKDEISRKYADGNTQEDLFNDIRLGSWRCIDPEIVGDTHHDYRILVSRQCPLGLVNDPRLDRNKPDNVEMKKQEEWLQDASGQTSWKQVPLLAS